MELYGKKIEIVPEVLSGEWYMRELTDEDIAKLIEPSTPTPHPPAAAGRLPDNPPAA